MPNETWNAVWPRKARKMSKSFPRGDAEKMKPEGRLMSCSAFILFHTSPYLPLPKTVLFSAWFKAQTRGARGAMKNRPAFGPRGWENS
jgi:hypothetical protein